MSPTEESWRPIPGYEGYEASDRGRVRSWRKAGPGLGRRSEQPKVLRPKVDRYGYLSLRLSRGGTKSSCTVHRLVYLAFKGLIPEGLVIRHLDGDQTHNVPGNLSLGTVKDNKADSIRHGTHAKGTTHGRAKLSEDQVREIRRLYSTGDFSQREIGHRFGVAQTLVSQILSGKVWADVA